MCTILKILTGEIEVFEYMELPEYLTWDMVYIKFSSVTSAERSFSLY